MAGQKIRIPLKAYDHEAIDASARKIVDTVTRTGARVVGPVPLPTEKNVYCVTRSPHKYKDSREHFEMRTHKRLIDILDPTPKTVDALMRIDLPAPLFSEIPRGNHRHGEHIPWAPRREAGDDPGLRRDEQVRARDIRSGGMRDGDPGPYARGRLL